MIYDDFDQIADFKLYHCCPSCHCDRSLCRRRRKSVQRLPSPDSGLHTDCSKVHRPHPDQQDPPQAVAGPMPRVMPPSSRTYPLSPLGPPSRKLSGTLVPALHGLSMQHCAPPRTPMSHHLAEEEEEHADGTGAAVLGVFIMEEEDEDQPDMTPSPDDRDEGTTPVAARAGGVRRPRRVYSVFLARRRRSSVGRASAKRALGPPPPLFSCS